MKYQHTLVIILVVFELVVLATCGPAAPVEPLEAAPVIVEENVARSDSELFAANPELMAVRRHLIEPKDGTLTTSDFYAANPELMVADRYPAATAKQVLTSDSTFFAQNPELMVAGRYQEAVKSEAISASTFFAANPELMAAHRYAAAEQSGE